MYVTWIKSLASSCSCSCNSPDLIAWIELLWINWIPLITRSSIYILVEEFPRMEMDRMFTSKRNCWTNPSSQLDLCLCLYSSGWHSTWNPIYIWGTPHSQSRSRPLPNPQPHLASSPVGLIDTGVPTKAKLVSFNSIHRLLAKGFQ